MANATGVAPKNSQQRTISDAQGEMMVWWSDEVQGNYPSAAIFDHKGKITYSELSRFARIILTEGVPHACSQFPMAFEFARERAAEKLGLHPKQLNLIGSARIGYSLAPRKFGQLFDLQTSDIDLFAVSGELFGLIVDEYFAFMKAWEAGAIKPKHELQRQYWTASRDNDPFNIERGFLDANHVPTFDRYPVAQRIGDAAYRFHVNLEVKAKKKIGRRATIRIYDDWDSAIKQIALTLKGALKYRDVQVED